MIGQEPYHTAQDVLDNVEIVDLARRYSYFMDHQPHDQLAELFLDDGVVDHGFGFGSLIAGTENWPVEWLPLTDAD